MRRWTVLAVVGSVCACSPSETSGPDGSVGDASDGGGPDSTLVDGAPDADVPDVVADADAAAEGGTVSLPSCIDCGSGKKLCAGTCVDVNDPAGGCHGVGLYACAAPCATANAKPTCVANACAVGSCRAGFDDCDKNPANGCEANLRSKTSCGACGVTCNSNEVCTSTGCASACSFPDTNCNGSCFNLSSSPNACGNCNTPCPSDHGTASCSGGTCGMSACDSGYTLCNGKCVDLQNDSANCGACGKACFSCSKGQCDVKCPLLQTSCGPNICANLAVDPANCGSCGVTCGGSDVCSQGKCIPESSLHFVTGLTTPTDVAVDANNVYWTDSGTDEVWQMSKTTLVKTKLASNQGKPLRIAVNATSVVWSSNLGGAILSAPIGGGLVRVVAGANQPASVAVDATDVYWADRGTTTLKKSAISADAGSGSTVATALCNAVAVDATHVYCVDENNGNRGLAAWFKVSGIKDATIGWSSGAYRLGIALSATKVSYFMAVGSTKWAIMGESTTGIQGGYQWLTNLFGPQAMARDDCAVYVSDGALLKFYDDGPSDPVVLTPGVTGRLAIDTDYIYWTSSGGYIGRIRR